jgi:hypothetical protein|tara:strand:+ start:1459 stop:1578 length:120 start_codon:yes stop_codon:yes gene_type:complete
MVALASPLLIRLVALVLNLFPIGSVFSLVFMVFGFLVID